MSKNKKKKKEKIVYYDDNSTICDMSNVPNKKTKLSKRGTGTARERWNTYWSAVKTMFLPMCFVLLILGILYLLLMLVTGNLF